MQWFKSAMVFSSVVFVAAMAAEGCTSKNPGGNDGGDGGIVKSDAPVKDIGTKDSPTTGCPSSDPACENCDVSSFSPIAQGKPITHANQCTTNDIAAFETACLATAATSTTCQTWQTAENTSAPTCLNCLFTEQTTASWGFLVCTSAGCSINIPGCLDVALGQTNQESTTSTPASCGDFLSASYGCQDAACSACSTTDFSTCANDAIAAECKTYADGFTNASVCSALQSDTPPAGVNKCFPASQSGYTDAEFIALVNVFCGGG